MIDRRRLPLNALRAFEAVALCRSFRQGAEKLSVTQSAVSRHVANLEEMLGRPLFARSGRRIELTAAGELLLPVVQRALNDLETVLNRLDASRSIRIHMPPAFLGHDALDLLREFRIANPRIAIDVTSSDGTGMPKGNADIAIVFQRAQIDDQVSDLLRPIRFLPLCLPELAPRPGESPSEFLSRSELLNVRISDMPDDHLWQAYAEHLGVALRSRPSVTFATAAAAADFARRGGGVMLGELSTHGAGDAESRLVAPFDVSADLGYGYYLRMRPEMLADPAVARFRKWLIERFADRTFPF